MMNQDGELEIVAKVLGVRKGERPCSRWWSVPNEMAMEILSAWEKVSS